MGKKKDLTGCRFGYLTVIGEEQTPGQKRRYWLCRCACGNETIVSGTHLQSGHTKSCGCYRRNLPKTKRLDLTGRKFGRLTALYPIETQDGEFKWMCRCECGNEISCPAESLATGNTQSCGCLKSEVRKENIKKAIHFVDGTCIERIASRKNCANNTSGRRGVYRRDNGKWRAIIGFQGKIYNLGTFARFEDAVEAREKAEKEMYDQFLEKLADKKRRL